MTANHNDNEIETRSNSADTKTAKNAEQKKADKKAAEKKTAEKKAAEKKAAEKKAAEKKAAEKKANKKKANKKKAPEKKPGAAKPKTAKKKSGAVSRSLKYLGGKLFAKMAKGGATELRSNADEVNKLNVFPVPDGDTGDNMRMTIESGVAAIEGLETDDLATITSALSKGMLLGARGNSGVILSQFFAGFSAGLKEADAADPATLGAALEKGVDQAYSTVMTPTEGTILTVAREAVEFAVSRITPSSTIKSFFGDLVKEMYDSVGRTPDLLPQLKEAGVVDSGGAGLFYIMDGLNRVLNGEEVASANGDETPATKPAAPSYEGFGPDSPMTYAYCTELLVQLMNAKCDIEAYDIDALRDYLSSLGDSVVAFKTDSIVKLHVHTFTPNLVLTKMLEVGEFITVKIENMSMQHTSIIEDEKAKSEETTTAQTSDFGAFTATPAAASDEKKKYGVVAVTNGEGIDALFREFGADETVSGGQTNNPSAQEFLDAFAKINAENIFVFPNNSNIFLAASQAAGIYEAAKIHVIPTKSIGTGYVALATMDFSAETPEDIIEAATSAIESVVCGYISPAIRDTQIGGLEIKNGDTIGIIGKDIVVDDPTRDGAALALADHMLTGDRYMMTVFIGKDTTDSETEELISKIKANHSSVEIYTIDAGQEIYPYIFVVE